MIDPLTDVKLDSELWNLACRRWFYIVMEILTLILKTVNIP